MCGILIYFAQNKIDSDHPSLTSIAHRGPDGFGTESFKLNDRFLTLGHRRLSIIDLTKNAAQPMQFHDTGLWITYNGEIYNYIELKSELRQFGYEFRSNSDTEVLLAAYHKWGSQCLEKLNGMFAFSIWDDQSKVLFAARDRFGVKPLYFWNSSHGLAIVSEIKQLIPLSGFKSVINQEALFQFLQYGDFSYDEQTLWKNVAELEPGMMFCVNLNNWKAGDAITPVRWYDYTCCLRPVSIDETEAVEQFRFLLEDSIKLRLRSDVPVGIALSGGLDSSSITCMVEKNFKRAAPLRTFSACYNESAFDERHFVNAVLKNIDVESHEVFLEPSYIVDSMDFATKIHDIPTTSMTILSHHLLCQAIKSTDTKVVLEGQGADETLAGYRDFIWSLLIDLLTDFHPLTSIDEYLNYKKNYRSSHWQEGKYLANALFPNAHFKKRTLKRLKNESIFNFDGQILDRSPKIIRCHSSISKMHQIRMKLLRSILHNVDRVSMSHSLEVRNPFLDFRLVEFCLKLPSSLKIRRGMQKYILRKALADILPVQVSERKEKMRFSSPDSVWAKGPLTDFYRDSLLKLKHLPFMRYKRVLKKFEDFKNGQISYDRTLWRLISFQRWLSVFKISI